MLSFRSILCPVDFSAHSAYALRHAAALASRANARLTIAWITDPLMAQAAVVYVLDPDGEQALAELREFVTQSLPQGPPLLSEPKLTTAMGKPEQEILRVAEEQKADLIVMGTHGVSGYRKMFFGSTTERVLRKTSVPVLAVPAPMAGLPEGKGGMPLSEVGLVVVALDLEPASAALAALGAGLAEAVAAKPLFVHVVRSDDHAPTGWKSAIETQLQSSIDRARAELSRLATGAGVGAAECVVLSGNPAEKIAVLATTRQAGLIVMGLLNHTGVFGARPGSIAYRVLILAPIPVLVVPPAVALGQAGS
jgi:nucleotide-binding universal stress UspA family protein